MALLFITKSKTWMFFLYELEGARASTGLCVDVRSGVML